MGLVPRFSSPDLLLFFIALSYPTKNKQTEPSPCQVEGLGKPTPPMLAPPMERHKLLLRTHCPSEVLTPSTVQDVFSPAKEPSSLIATINIEWLWRGERGRWKRQLSKSKSIRITGEKLLLPIMTEYQVPDQPSPYKLLWNWKKSCF